MIPGAIAGAGRRRGARLSALVVALLLLWGARPALAVRVAPRIMHATLISSDPAAGSKLAQAPSRIRLVFSEEIEAALGGISLIASDGKVTRLSAGADPRDVTALVASVGALPNGAYRVSWRVVSVDGHPIDGSFVFSIGAQRSEVVVPDVTPAPGPDPEAAAAIDSVAAPAPIPHETAGWGRSVAGAPLLPAALRGLGVGSLTALVGLLGFMLWPRRANSSPHADRTARQLGMATALFLTLHLVAWSINIAPEHRLSGDLIGALVGSNVGRIELARTVLALLACWALLIVRRPSLALAFGVGAILIGAGTGHSAAIQPFWTVPARALHLLALAAWLGGVLWLLVCERPDASTVAREAARVSSVALTAVIVVTLSGVLQTVLFLPSLRDLFTSPYGWVTLGKIGGMGILVLFGAHYRFRVLPRLAEASVASGFLITLRREAFVMSLVILLGGLLAYVPPPSH